MNIYFAAGIAVVFALAIGAEEMRLLVVRNQLASARSATAVCKQEFADYQNAAALEIAKRLTEVQRIEAARQVEIENARTDYASRIAAVNAKWLRVTAAKATARVSASAVPAPGDLQQRSVDAAAGGDGLPRCVAEDRGPELAALLREAEITAAKLIECQGAVHSITGG